MRCTPSRLCSHFSASMAVNLATPSARITVHNTASSDAVRNSYCIGGA